MEVAVKNTQGTDTGRKVALPTEVFGLEAPSDHAIYEDVRNIMANRRQGTHKSKERGEVQGSNKKPYKQKGTGNARPGSKRSPLWRHGGRVFGPRPRSYGFHVNKKVSRLARRSALTYKAREEKILMVETFNMDAPKTQDFIKVLDALELSSTKILFVLPEDNKNLYLSSRNLHNATVVRAQDLNTYDILNADQLVLVEGSLEKIQQQLG